MSFWKWQNLLLRLLSISVAWGVSADAYADGWTYWGTVNDPAPVTGAIRAHIATDGTNFYYATLADGIFRADLTNRMFTAMPTNGLVLCSAANTNALTIWDLAVTPRGTVLIGAHPTVLSFRNNSTTATAITQQSAPNTTPLIYYWDANAGQWQPATITGQTYPYTQFSGNFSFGSDGTVWTCSGFAPYVYKSTDDGHSYIALNLDERVPTNYFSDVTGETTIGRVFSILVGPGGELFAGTETAGYLHSKDGGQSWTSLDPDYVDTNSVNPLGRIGNASYDGIDRFGNILCVAVEYGSFPAIDAWSGHSMVAYRPADGSYFNASAGLPVYSVTPFRIYTTPAGGSFTELDQTAAGDGGVYHSNDGQNWIQFNTGIPALDLPHLSSNPSPGLFVDEGDCMAMLGNQMFVADAQMNIWTYDTTPLPVTNHPPSALPQNFTLWQNESTNMTLQGTDADGDALNFNIVTPPQWGTLSGVSSNLTYTPGYYFAGNDFFQFTVDDGQSTSTVATVAITVNELATTATAVQLLSPTNLVVAITPANVNLMVAAQDPNGIQEVDFWDGLNQIGSVTNAPYSYSFTNLAIGTHNFSALAVNSAGGTAWSSPATVMVIAAPLQLSLGLSASNQINVAWPLQLSGPLLETATNLSGPWSLVTQPPLDQNYSQHAVTLTNCLPEAYFRLYAAP